MKSRAVNSRFSRKPSPRSRRLSVNRLATRKWLTPSLSVLVALLFAGLPALRHAEFSRTVSAQQGKPAPLEYVVNSTGDGGGNVGADTTCADSLGRCTLRAAIEASNSHLPPDFISFNIPTSDPGFDPSTGIYTINLNQGLPDLTDSVIITGPGADKLTVQRNAGGGFYRIFRVTTVGTVDVSGLTIARGLVGQVDPSDDGGGIENLNAGTVNVTNSIVSGNSASSGGGIANMSSGTVSVTNSTITGNSTNVIVAGSKVGGGIYNHATGTVNVTNSMISGNSSSGPASGGISNYGTLTVAVSALSGNKGDGIDNDNNGTLTVTNSTISSNTGWGIRGNGTITVAGSTLSGNTGGGIKSGNGLFQLTVTGCTISNNNNTDGFGGGISNSQYAIVSNSTINGNSTTGWGGGIWNGGSLSVINSTISGNSASRPDDGSGNAGGIYNVDSSLGVTVANSTISGNTSPVTGGIFSPSFSVVQVKSTIVALNTGSSSSPDVLGPFYSLGFNLIGKKDESVGFTKPTDQTGTIGSPLDPKLDPNGLHTSAGVPLRTNDLTTDQRDTGFPRTFNDPNVPNAAGGDGTDIGAFEVQTAAPTPTPTPTPTPSPTPLASNVQFSASSYSAGEGDGFATITVTRTGDTSGTVSVDYATSDVGAQQRTDYTIGAGTLTFAPGDISKTFSVLIVDDLYVEGSEVLNLTLSNPTGGAQLNSPSVATLTIIDNDSTSPTTNPLDNARFFVQQHYYDFLSRFPDQGGWDFWTGQITQCGTDPGCIRSKRIDVSNAYFYELEYQQTGSYVFRLYRGAFGNNQPFPNPDNSNQTEAKKLPSYAVFAPDRARVVGGASLAAGQQSIANAFVLRNAFLAKYPASQDGPTFVDALLANIKNDTGVDLTSQRTAVINLFNTGGRGAVIYRLADDNAQTNPINNRAFIDEEYNRAFVFTQYAGYLRRDSDIGGFLFWLGQVNSAPLRDTSKQHAMVCAFITSAEYQQRFSSVVTHSNSECQ